jgi:hypothetical protein
MADGKLGEAPSILTAFGALGPLDPNWKPKVINPDYFGIHPKKKSEALRSPISSHPYMIIDFRQF